MQVENFIKAILDMPLTLFHLKGPGEVEQITFPTWKLLNLVLPTLRSMALSKEFDRNEHATIVGFINFCEAVIKEHK